MPRFNKLPVPEQMIVSLRSAEWLATAPAELFLPDFNAGEMLDAMSYFNIQIDRNGTPDVDEFNAMIEHLEEQLPGDCKCPACRARK
jgi:hypothetical protein